MSSSFQNPIRALANLLVALVIACGLSLPAPLAFADSAADSLHAGVASQDEGVDVDAVVSKMTLDEKVSQMIIPAIRTWKGSGDENAAAVTDLSKAPELAGALAKHQYGGIILYGSNVVGTEQTARLVSDLQVNNAKIEATTKIPYLVAVDEEGGIVTRLSSGTRMTGSMAIGATGCKAKSNAEITGEVIGEELHALGFNVDFAPSIDVNSNPANPVIGTRSFSDDPKVVSALGAAFGEGLAKNKVIATYKHFPGHGDTDTDSHTGLPSINKTREELDATELVPFGNVMDSADMIMTAHIVLPNIDDEVEFADGTKGYVPATMSKKIMNDILREEMGYDGVVVTDAIEMDAMYASNFVAGGNGATESKKGTFATASTEYKINLAEAIIDAGVDILLVPADLNSTDAAAFFDDYIAGIIAKVHAGDISEARIDESVRRILDMKKKHGIFDTAATGIGQEGIDQAKEIVGSASHHATEMEIAQQAVTMVKNDGDTLPYDAAESDIVIVGRTKADTVAIDFAVKDMQKKGYIPADAYVANLATGETSGSEESLTSVTIDYCYDAGDVANPRYSDELKEAVEYADAVICFSTNWGTATLQPTHVQYRGVATILGDARAADAETVLLSCNLPYDAARYQNAADAIVLCYMSSGTDVDPTSRGENLGYGANAYNANVIAALEAMFVPGNLGNVAALGPRGKLPVNIPEGVVDADGKFSYAPIDPVTGSGILYKRGFGLTYGTASGVDDDAKGGEQPAGDKKAAKAASKLKINAGKAKFTAKKSKKTVIKPAKAFKVVKNESKGKLSYAKTKGNKKIKISKNGTITIMKGLKLGKVYKVKVKATSAETNTYKSATTAVTLRVKVKK